VFSAVRVVKVRHGFWKLCLTFIFNSERELHMIIECPYCESKVDGLVRGEHVSYFEEDDSEFRTLLLECPVCRNSLLGGQERYDPELDSEWSSVKRLWPQPEAHIDLNIPDIVRDSLEEARRCFKARAYSACAVMCGRSLEAICNEYSTKSKILAGGLKELLDRKIIDDRLFQWGEELRKHRNIGAHATQEKISREDARDLLDFVNAICEYVFVLSRKFEGFMKRKAKNPAT
jgi:hypothetical protein